MSSPRRRKQVPPVIPVKTAARLTRIRQHGVQAVCFFNNKGGVGKTTLVANLAAQMGLNLGAKVLVVDADPQCNLSQYVLTVEEFNTTYSNEDPGPDSIYSIVHPLSMGKGYAKHLPVRKVPQFGCDVVIGDPRLALKEDLLAQDWRDAKSGGTRGLRTTFLFHDLIKRAQEYDFVFFDMGPSLGAINRSVLLAAHFFVVPMSIDIFSIWAIDNISKALTVWKKEIKNGIKVAEDPGEVEQIDDRPNFLGYVTQQHKERRESGKPRIVEAYNTISKQIPEKIKHKFQDLMAAKGITTHLGDIKHLASLAPKSQTLHTPMLTVSLQGSYTSLRKQARDIYNTISAQFLDNLDTALAVHSTDA